MLIIAGTTSRIEPAQRDVAVAAANEMMAETLKEKGCPAYAVTSDFAEPARIHLLERGESQAAQTYTISAVGSVR